MLKLVFLVRDRNNSTILSKYLNFGYLSLITGFPKLFNWKPAINCYDMYDIVRLLPKCSRHISCPFPIRICMFPCGWITKLREELSMTVQNISHYLTAAEKWGSIAQGNL